MKVLPIALLFLLLIPIVFADEDLHDPIFEGKTKTQDPFVAAGNNFTFSYEPVQDKVFVVTPASSLIVKNGQCNTNQIFMVCVDLVEQKNDTNRTYFDYEVTARIYQLKKSLEVTGFMSKAQIYPGEDVDFHIRIFNPNSYEAKDAYFVQPLDGFEIISNRVCEIEQNSFVWRGTLPPFYVINCNATLRGLIPGEYLLKPNISFYNVFFNDLKNPAVGNVTILPRQLSFEINQTNLSEINVPYSLRLGITNLNAVEAIKSKITFDLPRTVSVLEPKEGANNELHIFATEIDIAPNSTREIELIISPSVEGMIPIKYSIDYQLLDFQSKYEGIEFLNVSEPKPQIQFGVEEDKIQEGKEFVFVTKVINPAREKYFFDIKAWLSVEDNEDFEGSVTNLKPKESYSLIISKIKVNSNSTHIKQMNDSIRMNLSYSYEIDGMNRKGFIPISIIIPEKKVIANVPFETVKLSSSNTTLQEFTKNEIVWLHDTSVLNSSMKDFNYTKAPVENQTKAAEINQSSSNITPYEEEPKFFNKKRLIYIILGTTGLIALVGVGGFIYSVNKKNKEF